MQVLFMQFKVWGRRVEDLCKMLPDSIHCHYFIHAGLLHAHHELVQWRRCCCLQMKTSVFCLLLPLHFLSAYFAEMSFPPILSNLVHKGASVKWAYISPNDTIRMRYYSTHMKSIFVSVFNLCEISLTLGHGLRNSLFTVSYKRSWEFPGLMYLIFNASIAIVAVVQNFWFPRTMHSPMMPVWKLRLNLSQYIVHCQRL